MSVRDSASSSAGSRLRSSSASSPLTLASSAWCADTGKTCAGESSSRAAAAWTCRSMSAATAASGFRSSQRLSILFRTTIRAALCAEASPARSRFHRSRSERVTPASAASTNRMTCAPDSTLSVSSGSAPMALSPGVSMITRPCRSSGCGKLRIACRQQGTLTRASPPPISCAGPAASSSRPSARASATGTSFTCETCARAALELARVREIERKRHPFVGVAPEFPDGRVLAVASRSAAIGSMAVGRRRREVRWGTSSCGPPPRAAGARRSRQRRSR